VRQSHIEKPVDAHQFVAGLDRSPSLDVGTDNLKQNSRVIDQGGIDFPAPGGIPFRSQEGKARPEAGPAR
jgi:hypothetical protein